MVKGNLYKGTLICLASLLTGHTARTPVSGCVVEIARLTGPPAEGASEGRVRSPVRPTKAN